MLWIKNGTICTMVDDERIKNGCIAIEGKKIEYVGDRCEIPDKDEVIDAKGGFIIPGIIEAHCHIGITEEKKRKEGDDSNELTNPITPFMRAIDAINPLDPAFHNAIQAGITSVMVGPGSANIVGGEFAFIKTYGRCIDDMIVKAPAAMKVAFGENPKTEYGNRDIMPATRMAIAALLREEIKKAKQYQQKKKNAKNGEFEEDFRMEPWLPVLEKKIPLKAHAHRTDDILTAIRIAKEFDLDMTIDHCTEGHIIVEEVQQSGFPAICGPHLASRNKIEVQNADFKTPGVLAKAGVLVSVTTDHPVSLIQYLPICAGYAAKKGLDRMEALRAITINAAKICQVSDRVGSLKKGLDADIAIFDGDPLEVKTEVLYTIINGKVVYDKKNSQENES